MSYKMKFTQLIFFFSLLNGLAFGQIATNTPNTQVPPPAELHIKHTVGKITIDGKLDETDWQMAQPSRSFWQSIPYDTAEAHSKTEARMTFDDNFLYISGRCYQKRGSYIVQSLKRDFPPGSTDLFGFTVDPFNDRQNGFSFTVSPLGVQREGLIANGNEFSTDWDNRWFSAVTNEADYYIVEMAIPFKTLRYRVADGVANEWRVNFLRYDQSHQQAERSTWAFLPRFTSGNNVAFMGKLVWDDAPPKPSGRNVVVIPYLLGKTTKDFVNKIPKNGYDTEGGIGGDAKIAVTSSLNLDLTANPDFAQVEVDQQQTNLSRFELFFPERRQFFIENSDLFGRFGYDNINPFFSRRIGLAKDATGNIVSVPILAGARLTGKLDKNWRIGLLDMQTKGRSDLNIAASNFLATAIQRRIFTRSTVNFIFVNKQDFRTDTATGKNNWEVNPNVFNRVVGLDYNLASSDGHWQGKAFYHRSLAPTPQYQPFATAISTNYNSTNFNFSNGFETVGKGYTGDVVGYVPRKDYYRMEPKMNFVFYPKSKKLNSYSLGVDADIFWQRANDRLTDYDFSPIRFQAFGQSNWVFSLTPLRWDYTYLYAPFDPTNTGGKALPAGTNFTYRSLRAGFKSDVRKSFYFNLNGRFGEYFNGKINAIQSSWSYRLQPYGIISLDINYNQIDLPEGYNDRKLLLIGPRFDLSFTKSLFLTTYIQYNNQVNNVNLNARFQWRFAPVSDLFLVYTDNYFAEDDTRLGYRAFESKNRGLVLKCTYWLNL